MLVKGATGYEQAISYLAVYMVLTITRNTTKLIIPRSTLMTKFIQPVIVNRGDKWHSERSSFFVNCATRLFVQQFVARSHACNYHDFTLRYDIMLKQSKRQNPCKFFPLMTDGFIKELFSNAESVSMWWTHHVDTLYWSWLAWKSHATSKC